MTPNARRTSGDRRAFTLTELLVAVAVLVGVLLAVGKIFSTTSRVTGVGEANTDVLQEVAAVGRQVRDDLATLSSEGVFVIRCVEVPNDYYGVGTAINPGLRPDDVIRADQLLFFSNRAQGVSTYAPGTNADQRGQATVSRIYYGHAWQLAENGLPAEQAPQLRTFDVDPLTDVFPWTNSDFEGPYAAAYTRMLAPGLVFGSSPAGEVELPGVDARSWVMARQAVPLMDDDFSAPAGNDKTLFLGEIITARSLFKVDPDLGPTPQLRDGRVDASAMQLADLRRIIQYLPNGNPRPWTGSAGGTPDGYTLIADELLYYPRAERTAPSMDRTDQALTNHVIGTAVSSITIDWTYREGTGAAPGFFGMDLPPLGNPVGAPGEVGEQRWFGLADLDRGVVSFDEYEADVYDVETIFSGNIERFSAPGNPIRVYEAVFGFNQREALDVNGQPAAGLVYTPWPDAIRLTLTLHDPATTLESGRQLQFVISLPKRLD